MKGGGEDREACRTLAAEASKKLQNVESPSVLLVRGRVVRRSRFVLHWYCDAAKKLSGSRTKSATGNQAFFHCFTFSTFPIISIPRKNSKKILLPCFVYVKSNV